MRVRHAQIESKPVAGSKVFAPQEYELGAEAEVDVGDLWEILAGETRPNTAVPVDHQRHRRGSLGCTRAKRQSLARVRLADVPRAGLLIPHYG